MELKDSKTFENLQTAFAGESQARVKYEFYASQAKKDGYEQIAAFFSETSANEKEHAKLWYKAMHGGKVGPTTENLKLAAEGENYEWTDMYAGFAKTAARRSRHREGARGALPCPAEKYRAGPGVQPRRRAGVDLPQLRPRACRPHRPCRMPRLRPPAGLF